MSGLNSEVSTAAGMRPVRKDEFMAMPGKDDGRVGQKANIGRRPGGNEQDRVDDGKTERGLGHASPYLEQQISIKNWNTVSSRAKRRQAVMMMAQRTGPRL